MGNIGNRFCRGRRIHGIKKICSVASILILFVVTVHCESTEYSLKIQPIIMGCMSIIMGQFTFK